METSDYQKAVQKVSNLKTFLRKLIYVFILNVLLMIYLKLTQEYWMNHFSLIFAFFSISYLVFIFIRFSISNYLIEKFKIQNFTKKQRLFASHLALFFSILSLKVLIDLSRTELSIVQKTDYVNYLFWGLLIGVHFLWAFSSQMSWIRNWEERKINQILKK